jgi:hypothetical protein
MASWHRHTFKVKDKKTTATTTTKKRKLKINQNKQQTPNYLILNEATKDWNQRMMHKISEHNKKRNQ